MLFDTTNVLGLPSPRTIDFMPKLAASIEALPLDPTQVPVEHAAIEHLAFGVHHAKATNVDGRFAIVTGANAQVQHDFAEPWHDTGYRFEGDVPRALLHQFNLAWEDSGLLWTCGTNTDGRPVRECVRPAVAGSNVVVDNPVDPSVCAPMIVATRVGDPNPFSNDIDNPQDQAYLAAFAAARKHIHLETPNLNDDAAKRGLLEAVERGVTVDVVLSKGFNDRTESLPGQGGTNEANVSAMYGALAKAGVADACERLRIRWYRFAGDGPDGSPAGPDPVSGNGPRASHTKYATVDDEVAIVGTANMDTQSWNNAWEINVVVDDDVVARGFDEQLFLPDFDNGVIVDPCR
jgi:phosphatidylserine/phosphatidylglycerophosphate/cardiolipin synthase-like enzyme